MIDPRLSNHEIDLDAKLCTMGYSIEWIRWGVLTVPEFERQLADYEDAVRQRRANPDADVDTCSEHYRWRYLCDWFSGREELSDDIFDKVIWLLRHDPDQGMAQSVIGGFLCERFVNLTDNQFEYVGKLLVSHGMTDQVARQSVLRRVWTKPWSVQTRDLVLADCTGKQQIVVLEYVRESLTREDVEAFNQQSDSKAVRNVTKQMLNSRRFR